jgi:hypothetical protein
MCNSTNRIKEHLTQQDTPVGYGGYSKIIRRLFEDYSKVVRTYSNNLRIVFE